mgnify:CR=1 FL=1|tara:strand:- start:73 stop:516 length:444 start_codon:yes stop_codon:yes gene_type:complete
MTEGQDKKRPKKKLKTKSSSKGASSRNHRIPVQMLVSYKGKGNYLFDFSKNLGEGGVFIATDNPPPTGSKIDLMFTLPSGNETIEAEGLVMWTQEPIAERQELNAGMGVQFTDFKKDDRKRLAEFIDEVKNRTSPELTLEEVPESEI